MNRRKFLKICSSVALCTFGAIEKVNSMLMPAVVTSPKAANTNTSWSNWDEFTQTGWEGMPSSTLIGILNTTGSGANQTVTCGILSGADLVMTQFGTVPGATGSGRSIKRQLDAAMGFTVTSALIGIMHGATQYTMIWRIELNGALAGNPTLMELNRDHRINVQYYTNHYESRVGSHGLTQDPANSAGGGDVVHYCLWADGTTKRMGYGINLPGTPPLSSQLTHSDYAGTEAIDANGTLVGDEIFGNSTHTAGFSCYGYYVLFSPSENLITNDD